MDFYRSLYRIAKSLFQETDQDNLVRFLLDQLIACTGADKGFIVVHERGSFTEKYHVRFDRDLISASKRRFSRGLVREAIRNRRTLFSQDVSQEADLQRSESIAQMGQASILVTPLGFEDRTYAVIYMEKDAANGPFTREHKAFIEEFAELTGISFRHVLERETLEELRRAHAHDLLGQHNFEGIIGRHPAMVRLLETVLQVANADAPVLITGETGTGKELIAKAIFRNSPRKEKPFVTLHCGALPETLFESELFGHRKGSFTGATSDRIGRIANADGGTLFIDEVAEIPIASQAKLLRFFQFGEFQRIGSDTVEKVDVRIVAATHRDLKEMVAQGTFREDLYYRLNVLELSIPPLRQRRSDIPLLIHHFLHLFSQKSGRTRPTELARETRQALEQHNYPGNVRELAHIIERLCILSRPDQEAGLDILPKSLNETARTVTADKSRVRFSNFSNKELKEARDAVSREAVEHVEKAFVEGLLKMYEGNISQAAKAANMQRTYLHKLVAKYKPA